jgi:N-acetyl-anhydromuramyl-L-alanine amidase AmpD
MEDVYDPYDPRYGNTHSRVGNRKKFEPEPDHLPVSLKPVWWQHPISLNRPSSQTVDLIVIHRTSGTRLGNAFNDWFASQSHTGPHYSIDVDGHIIKHVREEKKIEHAGGRWAGSRNINDRSIGIEIVNPNSTGYSQYPDYATTGDPDYTYEQYRALIILLDRITTHFPDIGHRIVGHADVATGPPPAGTPNDTYGIKRNWDPGTFFEWERLEAEGLGMIPAEPSPFNGTTHYDGVFNAFPDVVLQRNDRDPGPSGTPAARYGGSNRPGFGGQPIRLLQRDLKDIGYSIPPAHVNGRFDNYTAGAVDRFKRHFFSGIRGQLAGGTVDAEIARRIKDVAEAVRSP